MSQDQEHGHGHGHGESQKPSGGIGPIATRVSQLVDHLQEVLQMAKTLAEIKQTLKDSQAKLDAAFNEVKNEVATLQQGGVSQADLDEINGVASDVADKAQQLSDLIPNTPGENPANPPA